jgi:hypothetical protein
MTIQPGDIVEFVGCSGEQIRWGSNDDPRSFLIIGKEYFAESVEEHSWHTKIKIRGKMGLFNSNCFKERPK